LPFKSVAEMIAYAKANPGKLTVATNGEGRFSSPRLRASAPLWERSASRTFLQGLGGDRHRRDRRQVQVGIDGITGLAPTSARAACGCSRSRIKTRVPLWPDTPAGAETVPATSRAAGSATSPPAGTPRAIVLKLNEEINRA